MLAEWCRRDLLAEMWVPSLAERALCERLRRRTDFVGLRASAQNRIFGLPTQWACACRSSACASPTA